MSSAHIRTELIPWEDAGFVHAYESAREAVLSEGLTHNDPKAAARVEQLMRANGYPRVVVAVDRTVGEALQRAARWTVWRDGPAR